MSVTRQSSYSIHRRLDEKESCQDAFLDPLKVILPVVFYGRETWSLTLREEHMLRWLFWWRYAGLTHWGRVTQICVFTLQLCKMD